MGIKDLGYLNGILISLQMSLLAQATLHGLQRRIAVGGTCQGYHLGCLANMDLVLCVESR